MLVIIIYQIYAQMTGLKLINRGHPQGRGIEDSRETSMRSPTTCGTKSRPYRIILILCNINTTFIKFFIIIRFS